MEAIKAYEITDINGGDDIEDGGHSHVDPHPTYRDSLCSRRCQQSIDTHINDPIARKMEALFMSFNMKIHSDESRGMTLRSTVITDF